MRHSIVMMTAASLLAVPLAAQPPPAPGGPTVSPASLGLFVYPAKGQAPGQQQQDEGECYRWAHQQTGIDPMAPAAAPPPQAASGPDGSAVKGAARGAVAGTAIGAIAGDTGDGSRHRRDRGRHAGPAQGEGAEEAGGRAGPATGDRPRTSRPKAHSARR